jgi:hypothetical protein
VFCCTLGTLEFGSCGCTGAITHTTATQGPRDTNAALMCGAVSQQVVRTKKRALTPRMLTRERALLQVDILVVPLRQPLGPEALPAFLAGPRFPRACRFAQRIYWTVRAVLLVGFSLKVNVANGVALFRWQMNVMETVHCVLPCIPCAAFNRC